ncbi:MAG: hypothetical protein A3C07_01215 [Candidatus Sungbacteria bacterium RIFCSPHIGHO2_02_FULL_47_11]|uniref:Uncharacterized protein n=1 Tax=Candidatus Sungbacteria bacterium RIFCSPHIGHO2_02_FULL_47_11 TaxID=1802270 RepID=A0A1G2KLZ2_9BACT|nr:MAG: hypothetical protein A3C07_01215 [Candidatus Sungbacteria bacterium RIFCSPHIGHO2_02_FULL_47_11]
MKTRLRKLQAGFARRSSLQRANPAVAVFSGPCPTKPAMAGEVGGTPIRTEKIGFGDRQFTVELIPPLVQH